MDVTRRSFLTHHNKTIIFNDFSNLESDAFLEVIAAISEMAASESLSHRLVLVDASNAVVDKRVMKALKNMTANSSHKISRTAIFGISGLQLLFMRTISRFAKIDIRPFENKDDALEWLTS
jgi:hypothetical protein